MGGSVCAELRAPQTITGGFVLVPVREMISTWRACRQSPLGVGDFRTWLACREMLARRCTIDHGRSPTYGFVELSRLTGVSQKRARASVNRLVGAGLLAWSDTVIEFPEGQSVSETDTGDDTLKGSIGGGKGSLVIPRRILRLLSSGARPALIATALAILLRCLSRGREGFKPRGRVKSTWIAAVFDVDLRRVKQARKELIALGWITPEDSEQWAMNRWGATLRIDLDWMRDGGEAGRRLPPPPAEVGRRLPPPESDSEPLRENNNQEPASGGSIGVEIQEEEKPIPASPTALATPHRPVEGKPRPVPREPVAIADGAGGPPLAPPSLNDVRAEDLKDTGRLLQLHDQAVARGLVGSSEADRLRFVGAAEHAMALGKGNPPGLFMYLVRGRLWRYLTQEDEDAAGFRLKRHLFGTPRGSGPGHSQSPVTVRPGLSSDALLVSEVRAAVARAGYRGDPFGMVRARDASWTRGRWDAASAELGVCRGGPCR